MRIHDNPNCFSTKMSLKKVEFTKMFESFEKSLSSPPKFASYQQIEPFQKLKVYI